MDCEKLADDQWKSVKDLCSTTTSILLVLFASLIVAFMGLMTKRGTYSAAIASARAVERQKELAGQSEADRLSVLGSRVYGRLVNRLAGIQECIKVRNSAIEKLKNPNTHNTPQESAGPKAGKRRMPFIERGGSEQALHACSPELDDNIDASNAPQQKSNAIKQLSKDNERDIALEPTLRDLAEVKEGGKESEKENKKKKVERLKSDPYGMLRELSAKPESQSQADLLQNAIEDVSGTLAQRKLYAQRRYSQHRAVAEAVTFKLLGLEILVGGIWAWIAWWFFFSLGAFYLWLSRRRLIRQCRRVWQTLGAAGSSPPALLAGQGGVPLWARPLPRNEEWPAVLAGSLRADVAADPLGALCFGLMVVCLAIGIAIVAPMGILSSWLLSPESITWERLLHAVLFTVLTGLVISLAATWFARPDAQGSKVELVGRRAWIAGAIGTSCVSVLYCHRARAVMPSLWPLEQRWRTDRLTFRTPSPRIRRARRKIPVMPSGFYSDKRGRIHYVPPGGKSRSLAGGSPEELKAWNGPFERSMLRLVQPSARTPFVYAAVRHQLKGLTHMAAGKKQGPERVAERVAEKAHLNRQPETQIKFRQAFDLVRETIRIDSYRRKQNMQLFRLLESIAINSQNTSLMQEVAEAERDQYFWVLTRWEENKFREKNQSLPPRIRQTVRAATGGVERSKHSRHSRRKQRTLERKMLYVMRRSRPGLRFGFSKDEVKRLPTEVQPAIKELQSQMEKQADQILRKAAAGEDFSSELAAFLEPPMTGVILGRYPSPVPPAIKTEIANQVSVARRTRKKKHLRIKKVRSRFFRRIGADLLA